MQTIDYIITKTLKRHYTKHNDKLIGDPTGLMPHEHMGQWQRDLKFAAAFNQNYNCAYCDKRLRDLVDLHHALISRADIVGVNDHKKRIIHHTYNVLVVHANPCHQNIVRLDAWKILTELYGQQNLEEWYQSMQKILGIPLPIFESEILTGNRKIQF